MTNQELMDNLYEILTVGDFYELPHCNPHGSSSDCKTSFQYLGMTEAGNLFRFVAVPGDWTVSLAPTQIFIKEDRNAKSTKY